MKEIWSDNLLYICGSARELQRTTEIVLGKCYMCNSYYIMDFLISTSTGYFDIQRIFSGG